MKWIFLLLAVAWALLYWWGRYSRKRVARRLVELIRANYGGRHEYREVAPEQFPHLDLAWYDETAGQFEGEGFVRLGNVENVTLNNSPHGMRRTFSRGLSGDGGRIVAAVYHVVPGSSARGVQVLKIVDLQTSLSNGSSLVTTNSPVAGVISHPPAIMSEDFPGLAPLDLLDIHRRRLSTFLAENPEVSVERVETQAQAVEAAHRREDLRAEHRRSLGGVPTLEELRRMAGNKLSEPELRKVAEEIARLREPSGRIGS